MQLVHQMSTCILDQVDPSKSDVSNILKSCVNNRENKNLLIKFCNQIVKSNHDSIHEDVRTCMDAVSDFIVILHKHTNSKSRGSRKTKSLKSKSLKTGGSRKTKLRKIKGGWFAELFCMAVGCYVTLYYSLDERLVGSILPIPEGEASKMVLTGNSTVGLVQNIQTSDIFLNLIN